ncbi:hypothetical protein [Trichormus sp. NMC-1]|nr:hypothetical protein [Trichormus sp. NMC-1]
MNGYEATKYIKFTTKGNATAVINRYTQRFGRRESDSAFCL